MTDKQALAFELERRELEPTAGFLDDGSAVLVGACITLLLAVVARVLLF